MSDATTISARMSDFFGKPSFFLSFAAYAASLEALVQMCWLQDAACITSIPAQRNSAIFPISFLKAWALDWRRRSTFPNDVGVQNSFQPKLNRSALGDLVVSFPPRRAVNIPFTIMEKLMSSVPLRYGRLLPSSE